MTSTCRSAHIRADRLGTPMGFGRIYLEANDRLLKYVQIQNVAMRRCFLGLRQAYGQIMTLL